VKSKDINPKRYPNIHAATLRGEALVMAELAGWSRVETLRREGHCESADRVARKLLGVVEPMSEEAKAKLREYRNTHKEELALKAKAKAQLRKRTKVLMKARGK
jgi:hypothetical protein